MRLRVWLVLSGMALAFAIALGLLFQKSQKERLAREKILVLATFTGDAKAFETLRALRDRSVTLLEAFVEKEFRVDSAQLERDLRDLASADEVVRLAALARLTLLPARADELLQSRYEAADPGLRERLKPVVLNRDRRQRQIAGFLTGLYSEHFNRLFIARRTLLERDCQSVPVQLFFAYAPFEQAWTMLRNSSREAQLRFLLLRLYSGRDGAALEHLEQFPADAIVREAERTWWPVEIEPLALDGAYAWTTRAAGTNGNTAIHLLRLSVRPAGGSAASGEWLHLDRWFRWTYLFEFRQRLFEKEAVVFAEGRVRKANQSWRAHPDRYRDEPEEILWLPAEPEIDSLIGPGRCETVRGIPPSVRVPVVAISRSEASSWTTGHVFAWARPLIPEPIRDRFQFTSNRFPVPKIFADRSEASGAKTRGRTRR